MRELNLLLVLLFFAAGAQAQNSTTVTTTVTDSGGVAWVNGTFEFDFVGPSTVAWPGGAFNRTVTGTLNGSAALSQSLPSNATITPSPTFWSLKVCPLIGIQQACFIKQFTISGATQPVTVTPPALSLSAGSLPTAAYADAEFVAPVPLGFIYFQALTSTTGTYRQCQGLTGSACTTWGNVAGSGGSAAFSAITSGTNTTAAMVVGSGASLSATGTGTITATNGIIGQTTSAIPYATSATTLGSTVMLYNPTDTSGGVCESGGGASCATFTTNVDSGMAWLATDTNNAIFFGAQSSGQGTSAFGGSFLEVDTVVNSVGQSFASSIVAVTSIGGNTNTGGCFVFTVNGPPCAISYFAQPSDISTDTFNGQDLVGYSVLPILSKPAGHSVNHVAPFNCITPQNSGSGGAVLETAVELYCLDIQDLGGFTTTVQAPIRIRAQTTPGSGAKFSIEADTNSGVASFADGIVAANVTDSALTSGRCVQAGAAGILTNAAGACGAIPFSGITSGTNTTAAMIVGTGASLASVPEFDIGAVGTNGVLGLLGTTSGKATFTAPAVAGTVTNPVTSSNYLAAPGYVSAADATSGFFPGAGGANIVVSGNTTLSVSASNISLGTNAGANPEVCVGNLSFDTCFSRDAAGVFDFGAGYQTKTATLQFANYNTSQAHLLISSTAPTISSGFGTSPSIVANNGTAAFTVNVGTGGVATSGVIGLPTATTGWVCLVAPNAAPQAAAVTYSAPTSTTSVTLTNYTLTTGVALAWTASTVLQVSCHAR